MAACVKSKTRPAEARKVHFLLLLPHLKIPVLGEERTLSRSPAQSPLVRTDKTRSLLPVRPRLRLSLFVTPGYEEYGPGGTGPTRVLLIRKYIHCDKIS